MRLQRVNADAADSFRRRVTAGIELAYQTCEGDIDRAVGECGASASQAVAIHVESIEVVS
jgi:hypothetical protein